jgi:hypothetical protein
VMDLVAMCSDNSWFVSKYVGSHAMLVCLGNSCSSLPHPSSAVELVGDKQWAMDSLQLLSLIMVLSSLSASHSSTAGSLNQGYILVRLMSAMVNSAGARRWCA